MSRESKPLLVWQEDEEGESAGPYTIRLEAPRRWQLLAKGRPVGFHETKTAARQAATGLHRRQDLRRRLIGYLMVAGVSLVGLGAALVGRTEPNPDYPPARAVADRFDQAKLAVERGRVVIEQVGQLFDGIEGGSFEHGGRLKLGLTGVFDGDCYAMTWRSGYPVGGVVIRSNYVTCKPDPSLIDQPDPPGLVAEPLRPSWKYALPDPERTRVWFIPVVAIFFGLFLATAFRAAGLLFAFRE
jgi:hypothetical protein